MAKIFLIEDDEKTVETLVPILIKNGYELKVAENGKQALEIWKKEKKTIDLVLLDLIIPQINGFEVLKIIKTDKKSLLVLVLTNVCQDQEKERALSLGADEYLIKSTLSIKEIVERVKERLRY